MKQISEELAAHYASGATTLARLCRITRLDGQVHAFTDHDEPLEFDSAVFDTISSFDPSAISSKAEMNVDNLEIAGLIDDDGVTREDIDAGLWDGAAVELFEVNWRDLSMGANILPGAVLGEMQRNGNRYKVELRGIGHKLQNIVGRKVDPTCDAQLGDVRCKVVLSPTWQREVEVTAVVSRRIFTTDIAEAADWATYGKATFTSGANEGISMEIKTQAADGVITLQLDMPRTVTVGDLLTITAGCNKIHQVAVDELGFSTGTVTGDCKNKFSNVVNFRGYDGVPTSKAVTLFGGQE